jgi:hypothetical protein
MRNENERDGAASQRRSEGNAAGDRWRSRAVDVEITRRRQGTTHPIAAPLTSEDRIEGTLVEEDGTFVLFYGPI